MNQPHQTIAIIGAGFCGTTVAVRLLREPAQGPRQILLIDPAAPARGIAYAHLDYPYLLNVPAGRMSAEPEDPLAFLRFARAYLPEATAEDFLPRHVYGDYLEGLLRTAEEEAQRCIRLVRLISNASAVEPISCTSGFRIRLSDARTVTADSVVLATGNPSPGALPGSERLFGSNSYVADPWSASKLLRPSESVLTVGTGLTMADIVIAGAERVADLRVHAISRHGLLPLRQTAFRHVALQEQAGHELQAARWSIRQLFHKVRELASEIERQGGDWREVVTYVRDLAPTLWQRLQPRERARFLRHARAYWEIHRHRLPQQTFNQLQRLRERGQLTIHAGRILDLEPANGRVRVSWRVRGSSERSTLVVDRIVNCTGPDFDARRSTDPLMQSLTTQGLVAPDKLGLGIRTAADGRLIDSRGAARAELYYIGPMLRSRCWESTAVQELREHAILLAQHLARPVPQRAVAL